ncbi:Putative short-chain dehydrogenase/reductase SDR, NAD(P)-binding domain superfamily [Septoria linicola]|uniref:Short-chain dehydrogenase/reductase SDR, NAD(P)-binding domain superfamily n=1 Tax=Septoria linicola TaxID=215465 RepID=A0A9Q9ATV9_9PEZI|nr:Putative short-chain dehydrogenase/reductase SDR, NAD(P)-binding domain superfamily [Septoria linicola]
MAAERPTSLMAHRRSSQIGPGSNRNSAALSSSDKHNSLQRTSTASAIATTTTQSNRLVLITGATGGIGKATAVSFARTGTYNLALHFNTADAEAQESLIAAISEVVPAVIDVALFQADLSSYDEVRKLHKEVVDGLGKGVDVLFSNAGTTGGLQNISCLADVPIETFESTWRVNAGSPFLLAQLCLPHMEQQGWGRIIFNSSVAALNGGVVGPHYASSKSALHGFVHWLGGNVAKKGITVNAIAPALVEDTAMLPGGSAGTEKLKERLPVGRLGRPEEIAETVMWMVNTGYLTRKIVPVDGGFHPY